MGKSAEHAFAAIVEKIAETTFHLIGGTAFGVDGYIEFIDPGKTHPSGKLIGVQIKTGSSHLRCDSKGKYSYQGDLTHLEYWENHRLRIIVVFVDTGINDGVIWQEVASPNIVKNSKTWKLLINPEKIVDKASGSVWREIVEKQTPYEATLAQLSFAEPWMRLCESGKIVAEFEEWVNKSSGRGDFLHGRSAATAAGNERSERKVEAGMAEMNPSAPTLFYFLHTTDTTALNRITFTPHPMLSHRGHHK